MLVVVLSGSHVGFSKGGEITQFRLQPNKTRTALPSKNFCQSCLHVGHGVRSGKTPQFWYIVITRVQWQRSILATATCKQSCTCCAACFMFGPDLNSTYEPFTFPGSIMCWPMQFLDLLFSQVPQAATSRIVLPSQLCMFTVSPTGHHLIGPNCSAAVFRRPSQLNEEIIFVRFKYSIWSYPLPYIRTCVVVFRCIPF